MFGRMMVTPILQIRANADQQTAITLLSQAAEQAEIGRWIEFPNSVLLFLLVPGDPESVAVYILDRRLEPGTPSTSTTSNTAGTAQANWKNS